MKQQPLLPVILLALAIANVGGCRSSNASSVRSVSGDVMARTELYFGLSRPDGGPDVTAEQCRHFMDEVITPRFPSGLTILSAEGQWRERSGRIVREESRIVVILHRQTADDERKLEAIREIYKRRFDLESVLRVDDVERVRF